MTQMQGKVVADHDELWSYGKGAILQTRVSDKDGSFETYTYMCPQCGSLGMLAYNPEAGQTHFVEVVSKDVITVRPQPDNSNSIQHDCGWHGYIYENVWTPA